MSKEDFNKLVEDARNRVSYPAVSLVRNDPSLAAALSKVVPSRHPTTFDNSGNKKITDPNTFSLRNVSEHTAQRIIDNKTTFQLLPDLKLALQILISSVLSPKDMVTTEINFVSSESLAAPEITTALINRIKTFFEQDYKIKPLLPKILHDVLGETGSYAVAVLPENTIDEVINSNGSMSLESLSDNFNKDGSIKPLHILGRPDSAKNDEKNRTNLAVEMFAGTYNVGGNENVGIKDDPHIFITDNYNVLKVPQINQKVREMKITKAIGSRALESVKLNDKEVTSMLYRGKKGSYNPITVLKTQEQLNRKTVGNPLILHFPSESVLPVFVPGSPDKQVGLFVLLDIDGNPINKTTDIDHFQQLSSRLNANGNFASAMISKVKQQMTGFDLQNNEHISYVVRTYAEIVEQDLLSRLRNGVYGNGVAIAKNEEIYRIMLSRSLSDKNSQLLFVPIELMTYIAFDYNDEGIGKSLMDDMKILNSLRAMLMFSNVMASLKNSIGRTEVKIKLDEDDPNPQKTIEQAIHEIVRTRQQYFPLGVNSPTDITDWLMKSGFEFVFEGHPGLPDVNVDFGEKSTQYVKPDTDLEDTLRKRSIMGFGLSPETVDASYQAEFATMVVQNNLLLSKRVTTIQEDFCPQFSNHLRKVILNSENLLNELRDIIKNNIDKLDIKKDDELNGRATEADKKEPVKEDVVINRFLQEFIMNFELTLPSATSAPLENQKTALEGFSNLLDAAIEAWVSDKFFTTDVGGDVANQVSTFKEAAKAYFLRKFMSENGIMTELSSLTTLDHDGRPTVDVFKIQEDHINALTKSLTEFIIGIEKAKTVSGEALSKISETGSDMSSTSSSSGGSDDTGNSGTGGGFDLPELDFDLDGGGTEGKSTGGGDDKQQQLSEAKTSEETPPEGGEKKENSNLNGD